MTNSWLYSRNAQMPAVTSFEPTENRLRENPEMPDLFISVLDVSRYSPRKDMIHEKFLNTAPCTFDQCLELSFRIGVGHRTTFLGLRILRDDSIQVPEGSAAIGREDRERFPGVTMI